MYNFILSSLFDKEVTLSVRHILGVAMVNLEYRDSSHSSTFKTQSDSDNNRSHSPSLSPSNLLEKEFKRDKKVGRYRGVRRNPWAIFATKIIGTQKKKRVVGLEPSTP